MQNTLSKVPRKVLVSLAASEGLKFIRSPQGYFKILDAKDESWQAFNKKSLYSALAKLYSGELISIAERLDGFTEITVTDEGRRVAAENSIYEMVERPPKWDKKWRLVFFDIPEDKKNSREAFRYHLKKLSFAEFHKSTFIFPYSCSKEVETLAERFDIKPNIRMAVAESVDNEFDFKKLFSLL